ncbi:G1/S-specific cyclin-D2-like [Agrilus planipennis]|uniref:G1/S-specific cyclin-D2-like n=1 Tax=Agrilus planipennis TaxID=224129 RepID=A0A1W4X331_AGRPL|nr:G1/S-specific cyclin-D2-like [Agrilus planipennis]
MELTCIENMATTNFAKKDPIIFRDSRVIENLLKDQGFYVPRCNYFDEVQTDIEPFMRKVVTTWMLEVCEEQMCEDQILPLAINYMDRFLCVCAIKRQQLQLLGATCLLIASKFRSSSVLTIDLLCAYTDYSVTYDHISSWEVLVLSKLQWNIAAVTGYDYIDQVIERFHWGNESILLRRHAHTLVSICYTEPSLVQTPPSLIAAACICSAIRGLKLSSDNQATRDVCYILNLDPISLELLVRFVDQIVEKVVPQKPKPNPNDTAKGVSNNGFESPNYKQPETPTEVENVYF